MRATATRDLKARPQDMLPFQCRLCYDPRDPHLHENCMSTLETTISIRQVNNIS